MDVFRDQSTVNIALVTSWSIHLLDPDTLKKLSDDPDEVPDTVFGSKGARSKERDQLRYLMLFTTTRLVYVATRINSTAHNSHGL
jgi:hypothetical protein